MDEVLTTEWIISAFEKLRVDSLGHDDTGELRLRHPGLFEALQDLADLHLFHVGDLSVTNAVPGKK